VDHQQALVLEFDSHHLQRDPIGVIAEEDEPWVGSHGSAGRGVLLEAQTTMLDDVARAFTGDPVPGRGASPQKVHVSVLGALAVLSDNINSVAQVLVAEAAAENGEGGVGEADVGEIGDLLGVGHRERRRRSIRETRSGQKRIKRMAARMARIAIQPWPKIWWRRRRWPRAKGTSRW
jgi:hypothetical protein